MTKNWSGLCSFYSEVILFLVSVSENMFLLLLILIIYVTQKYSEISQTSN